MNSLFKKYKGTIVNLFWRTLQIGARNGFSFLIFYLSSLFLPKEDFGYYNYILKITFFITLFIDFGISVAVSKYVAEYDLVDKKKIKPLMANSIIIIMLLASVAVVIVYCSNVFLFNGRYNHIISLLPLMYFVPLTSLFDAVFRGQKRFQELSLITFGTGLISFIFFYILIRQYGLTGAFHSQNLFYLIMLAGFWLRYRIFYFKFDKLVFSETYKYVLVIGVIGVFMFLSTQVDVLFLGYYGYLTEVAYFEIIFRFLTFLMMPYVIIGHVLSPDFTKNFVVKNYQWVKLRLKKSIFFSFISSTLVCIILYYTLPFVFEHFFTKYNSADLQKMSNIMLVLIFSNMFNGFIPLLAIATGHARWGMYFIVGVGLLNVVFDYISITHWGLWGMIYVTVILKSLANIMFIGYYYNKLPD